MSISAPGQEQRGLGGVPGAMEGVLLHRGPDRFRQLHLRQDQLLNGATLHVLRETRPRVLHSNDTSMSNWLKFNKIFGE